MKSTHRSSSLSDVESQLVAVFVRLAEALAIPRSIGEIYGILFCTDHPLCFEDITRLLKISTGSASQGLRFLKNIGAVHTVYQPGERRDFFTPETSLRKLAGGFLRERVAPHFAASATHLEEVASTLATSSEKMGSKHLLNQLHLLRNWQARSASLLPIIHSLLEEPINSDNAT